MFVKNSSRRFSPLLLRPGRVLDLDYAPAPWILKQCVDTGIIFLANPPVYEELSETYAYEVTFERESQARRRAEPIRYAISTAIKRFRARVLKRNKVLSILRTLINVSSSNQINVLDVGCGWGDLLQTLMTSLPHDQRMRVVPHGVEISRELSRLSDEKLRLLNGRCVHACAKDGIMLFDEDFFDVIIMASFLEHEVNPVAVLESCRKRLKANGTIIVKVPNFACFNRILRGKRWSGFRWPDHVNYFTPATLRTTASMAGLEIARMTALDTSPCSDNMYALLRVQSSHQ